MKLWNGDCLELMHRIPNKSIDAVICDPPYGTTACKWDSIIPLDQMWAHLKRVIKPNGAIILFGRQPFTTRVISSNLKGFKYCWVWNKKQGGHPGLARFQPLRITEDIIVFNTTSYKPQMVKGKLRKKGGSNPSPITSLGGSVAYMSDSYYPTCIIELPNCANKKDRVHPTQKPVALMEYMIKTYTNEGESVLDFTMGSGTTGVACVNTGRDFIGIEQDPKYFEIAKRRIHEAQLGEMF